VPRKLFPAVAAVVLASLFFASAAFGGLVAGSLPSASFTYTSDGINAVSMTGPGINLKTKGLIDAKTTFSIVAPSPTFQAGWHYHNGPVIVTVTTGTLTFFGNACQTWDVTAGHTYIESIGQILNAKVLPDKNTGVDTVQWFTTRLYPDGALDPVPVTHADC
jgi:hypothetical protein